MWGPNDIDYVSIALLEELYEHHWTLGAKWKEVHWLITSKDLKDGIRPLSDDSDVRKIYAIVANEMPLDREIHFSFIHEGVDLGTQVTLG